MNSFEKSVVYMKIYKYFKYYIYILIDLKYSGESAEKNNSELI